MNKNKGIISILATLVILAVGSAVLYNYGQKLEQRAEEINQTFGGSYVATKYGGTGTSTTPVAGQVLIGYDSGSFSATWLVAGSNITIATSTGSITISAGGTQWSTSTGPTIYYLDDIIMGTTSTSTAPFWYSSSTAGITINASTTFKATTTFDTTIPILPTATPTKDYEISSKAYANEIRLDRLGDIETFATSSSDIATSTAVTKDTFITVKCRTSGSAIIKTYVGATTTPPMEMVCDEAPPSGTSGTCSFFVPENYYYGIAFINCDATALITKIEFRD